jgi:hypothetical protein
MLASPPDWLRVVLVRTVGDCPDRRKHWKIKSISKADVTVGNAGCNRLAQGRNPITGI